MISESVKRYARAKERVEERLLNPVTELLEAAAACVAEARLEARETREMLEELRPVWAQGRTSDGEAAQSSANALASLWALLGVTDQTAAVERLKALLEREDK